MNEEERDKLTAMDRYEQLLELLHAARIRQDIYSGAGLLQIAFDTFLALSVTEEEIKKWVNSWFDAKRIVADQSVNIEMFLSDMLKKASRETKES